MNEKVTTTLQQLFDEQAGKSPERIAIAAGGEELTYRELAVQADVLAGLLQQRGVRPGDIVGILLHRSVHILVAMLAVIKAGAAYLPLDPDYPAQRIAYMLADSRVRLLINGKKTGIAAFEGETIDIADAVLAMPVPYVPVAAQPDALAYLIYTSGSTGRPKGVMIEHHSVCNMIAGVSAVIDFSPGKSLLSLAPVSFDMSVFEIWAPLMQGVTVILGTEAQQQNMEALKALFATRSIQMVMMTPSRLQLIKNTGNLGMLSQATEIMAGGEAFVPSLLPSLCEHTNAKIYNLYGPTETTVWSSAKELTPTGEITVGYPLLNTYIYILDEDNALQPAGTAGELCIGGAGVARGYWNRPELTREKFVPNPFRPGEAMYRTGDLARLRSDGEIEHLGRIDQQVKIRGYRIELGEIENVLTQYPGIQAAVVIAREDKTGSSYLCAYFVAADAVDEELLRQHIGRDLPAYMLPSRFMQLPAIPLTANGKIDRAALPEPQGRSGIDAGYQAPCTATEACIASLWEELLVARFIGREDDFFALGGHSLSGMYFLAAFQQATGIELTLKDLFDQPQVWQLALLADSKGKTFVAPIMPAPPQAAYPVSPAQKRFFFLHQLCGDSTVYNVPVALTVSGKLDRTAFDAAWRQLLQRQEVLRTAFQLTDGEVRQQICRECDATVAYQEVSPAECAGFITGFIRPFVLEQAPLVRTALLQLGPDSYLWLLDLHHSITDGISVELLIKEFFALYTAQVNQIPPALPAQALQFKDYVCWQQARRKSVDFTGQAAYWQQVFADGVPLIDLPLDYPRPVLRQYRGDQVSLRLERELTTALHSLARRTNTTLFTLLLASYGILLSRYSNQQDVVIGTAAAGRLCSETVNMLGPFVNTLALRSYPEPGKTFAGYAAEVKEVFLGASANQDYQFEELVELLGLTRDAGRNPVFDVMFLLEEKSCWQVPGLTVDAYDLATFHQAAMVDMTLLVEVENAELKCKLQYSTELFCRETMERLLQHFREILRQVTAEPSIPLAAIDMLTAAEKRQLLEDFNATELQLPERLTIQELFEQQVCRTPQALAIIAGATQLSYQEVNNQANQLAWLLRQKGVGPDCVVGLMVTRSPRLLIAILAVLKAGGAYLPLDPDYPATRIAFMLSDSKAKLLITEAEHFSDNEYPLDSLYLEDLDGFAGTGENPAVSNQPEHLAYIIYTSGSTGMPKGVLLEHRSVVNFIVGMHQLLDFSPGKRILNLTTVSFDIFVLETLVPLCAGATVVMANEEQQHSVAAFRQLLAAQKVAMVQMTPSRLQVLKSSGNLDCLASLTDILLGGEALPPVLLAALTAHTAARIYNMYGPTETTVWSMVKQLTDQDITIGCPISNTRIYIVAEDNRLQPVGVPGELCIGGRGLARGYWNRPELTAAKFVPDPFRAGEWMYRTGDLAKWRSDGEVEFLGRIDYQVKVRGYRVELGEIESCLLQYPHVKEVVVTAKEDKAGDKYLCAYFTSSSQQSLAAIRKYVSGKLPEYMVPSYFIALEQLPLTPNGKIDRNALPEPVITGEESAALPQTGSEALIASLWQEILGVSRLTGQDDFFALGGHSLKAMSFLARLHKETGVELSLRQFFANPTLSATAEYLSAQAVHFDPILPLPAQPDYELSPVQQRMYFLTQYADSGINYNIPFTVLLEGRLELAVFQQALQQLLERHEVLRTSFVIVEGKLRQRIQPAAVCRLEYQELPADRPELVQQELAKFLRPFDFSQAPLLRCKLLKLAAERHYLLVDIHHSIADGASIVILLQDFAKLYQMQAEPHCQTALPELKIQYKDFAAWQNRRLAAERVAAQGQYWRQVLAGNVPVLELPTDYIRPEARSFAGKVVRTAVGTELTARLKELARQAGVTDFMLLFAAFTVLLFKYSQQEDLVVGTVTSGRSHADIEQVAGVFINTLAVRSRPAGSKAFRQYLAEIKESVLAAFDNQEYQFEQLVDDLALERQPGRNPLFDTMFLLQNNTQVDETFAGLRMSGLEMGAEEHVAQMDLLVEASETDGQYVLRLNYDTELFAAPTISRLAAHFKGLLQQIVAQPSTSLAELRLITAAEEQQLLARFNAAALTPLPAGTINQLFEQQAAARPDAPAVIWQGTTLSYGELNRQANLLAAVLREKGVGPNMLVGLLVDRSWDMFVGIFGILKAGGAYLPIDPHYPPARIAHLLRDSQARLLVTRKLTAVDFDGLTIDLATVAADSRPAGNLPAVNDAADLAYVIYTSGSTGLPKGVMIEHRSVLNLRQALADKLGFAPAKQILAVASYAFDMSVPELVLPLISGMTVVLAGEQELTDIAAFARLLENAAIDILQITPSRLALLHEADKLDCLQAVNTLVVGAEPFPQALQSRLCRRPDGKVYNIYGPTETTVWSMLKEVTDNQPVTLGAPLLNTRIYIVNEAGALQPVGVPGELCIGGSGLARGYWRQEALTAERFVPDPFLPGARMYRTGDLAKWTENGDIEFIGRKDEQVKIRGYRIELGEIQSCLAAHPAVKTAVVVDRPDRAGITCLCAYLVAGSVTAEELREYLRRFLPEYMIPAYFIKLETIPLTPNGKVNRQALPAPEQAAACLATYQAPQSEFEQQTAQVWQDTLQVNQVGLADNFFELGGDSLTAMLATYRLAELGYTVKTADLFQHPTVGSLSEWYSHKQTAVAAASRVRWLPGTATAIKTKPELRLFCLPFAGASAAVYAGWEHYLAPEFELCLIELPGRGLRSGEPLTVDFAQLLADIEQLVKPWVQAGPYAIFGHSLGALLGYELTGRLLAESCPAPVELFLSGTAIPEKLTEPQPFSQYADSELKALIDCGSLPAADEQEIWQTVLPVLRADYRLLDSYGRYARPLPPLPCDLTVLNGTAEEPAAVSTQAQWQSYTQGICRLVPISGGHMFVREQAARVAETVNAGLLRKTTMTRRPS